MLSANVVFHYGLSRRITRLNLPILDGKAYRNQAFRGSQPRGRDHLARPGRLVNAYPQRNFPFPNARLQSFRSEDMLDAGIFLKLEGHFFCTPA